MAGRQRIDRVRRQYNQWVANQTLEDYALRFTAKSARRWSAARVANTALGAISFLALEAIGGTIAINYGFANSAAAILVVSLVIFVCGLPIAYQAARCGIDIDLLTRGAGFGYIGSTLTSLIYASFTFIFFALEAAVMAYALDLALGIPAHWGYLLCALVVIPLVTHGVSAISRLQVWTQPPRESAAERIAGTAEPCARCAPGPAWALPAAAQREKDGPQPAGSRPAAGQA